MLLQIMAPHFTAGALFEWDKRRRVWHCYNAAPIIKWLIGKDYTEHLVDYFDRKGWSYTVHD